MHIEVQHTTQPTQHSTTQHNKTQQTFAGDISGFVESKYILRPPFSILHFHPRTHPHSGFFWESKAITLIEKTVFPHTSRHPNLYIFSLNHV
jgi:hypothetical protein